jgi:integrase
VPPRNKKKSKTEGLYKRCGHLSWDKCDCPWWGRVKGSRVSLEKWAGRPIASKELAKQVLSRMESAVFDGTFDKAGERPHTGEDPTTFAQLLDDYEKQHVEAHKLRSDSTKAYIGVFRKQFGAEKLSALAADPLKIEIWLQESEGERKWTPATYMRYVQFGRGLFNWAVKRKKVAENPFAIINPKPGIKERGFRFSAEQEARLLAACELLDEPRKSRLVKVTSALVEEIRERAATGIAQKDIAAEMNLSRALVCQIVNGRIWNPSVRRRSVAKEMRRRLIAALDTGLRQGEMLLVQVKHVDYEQWVIQLPAANTKGGATTGEDEEVEAGTERLRAVLTERRFLGPEGYVFGKENGDYVASFDKSWRRLFKLAGLPVGRKSGYVWHDARHEYGSTLVEHGATIVETKEMMRHRDIRTTARYLTANKDRKRELAAKADRRA